MPIQELKSSARQRMHELAPRLFLISTLYVILSSVLGNLQVRIIGTGAIFNRIIERLGEGEMFTLYLIISNIRITTVLIAALIGIFSFVLGVGFMSFCLRTARKQETDYSDIFEGFSIFVKAVLLYLLTSLFIFLWSLLLIIPGVIAQYRYRQAYYILLDAPEKSIMQCINESKVLMDGAKLDLFMLDVSFLAWILLNMLVILFLPLPFSLPIVLLYLAPYQGITRAKFYETLVKRLVV